MSIIIFLRKYNDTNIYNKYIFKNYCDNYILNYE